MGLCPCPSATSFALSEGGIFSHAGAWCRDRMHAPFRCLDAQYRRELVRVYLTNVETLCRKFVDEKREALAKMRDDSSNFRAFWAALDSKKRRHLASERAEVVLKVGPSTCLSRWPSCAFCSCCCNSGCLSVLPKLPSHHAHSQYELSQRVSNCPQCASGSIGVPAPQKSLN